MFASSFKFLSASVIAMVLIAPDLEAQSKCKSLYNKKSAVKFRSETKVLDFDMPGMLVASVSDSTMATGATLFLFPNGAKANFDARGGSVASAETTLLAESSYSNEIDGVVFSGGSTMGLAALDGVRKQIFKTRSKDAGNFDFIPSIPGAVIYDFGARIEPGQNKLKYPDSKMGEQLFQTAAPNEFVIGRAGAGTSATANKRSEPIWGGQGAAFKEVDLGDGTIAKIFTAVILNPVGDVNLPVDLQQSIDAKRPIKDINIPKAHKQNTTLSIVVTDVDLDRSQLKRLANMVHTSMASSIFPFHAYTDGDIMFAVSLGTKKLSEKGQMEAEEAMQNAASKLMRESILSSVKVANQSGPPVKPIE